MSTPAIRAMGVWFPRLALALLVPLACGADDHHAPVVADDLALLAHRLDAGTNLHRCGDLALLVAVDDATSGEVVGGELDLDPVAGEDADAVHPHAARRV